VDSHKSAPALSFQVGRSCGGPPRQTGGGYKGFYERHVVRRERELTHAFKGIQHTARNGNVSFRGCAADIPIVTEIADGLSCPAPSFDGRWSNIAQVDQIGNACTSSKPIDELGEFLRRTEPFPVGVTCREVSMDFALQRAIPRNRCCDLKKEWRPRGKSVETTRRNVGTANLNRSFHADGANKVNSFHAAASVDLEGRITHDGQTARAGQWSENQIRAEAFRLVVMSRPARKAVTFLLSLKTLELTVVSGTFSAAL